MPKRPWILVLPLIFAACSPPESGSDEDAGAEILRALRSLEDARDDSPEAMAVMREALAHDSAAVRRVAVRTLGRYERSDWIGTLSGALDDPDAGVRAEAVNAIGQASWNEGWPAAWTALIQGLAGERDPVVQAVYGQTLGRLAYDGAEAHAQAERVLVDLLAQPAGEAGTTAADARGLALARGLESLARRGSTLRAFDADTRAALAELAQWGRTSGGSDARQSGPTTAAGLAAARVRRAALLAYTAGSTTPERSVLATGLSDPDHEVRRVAARGLAALADPVELLGRALIDSAPRVRWEALRTAAALRASMGCEPLFRAASDTDDHVALLALDELAEPCPEAAGQLDVLARGAADVPDPGRSWHRWAHAVAALATVAPHEAGSAVVVLSRHRSPFARAYAAPAAAARSDEALLRELARDPHPNVRLAAIRELVAALGHGADPVLVGQLSADDPQLVMTAAGLLAGSPQRAAAVPALLEALSRFTEQRRDTSRDVRAALLERLGELGDPTRTADVVPYLVDFDPVIAGRAAELLTDWTGEPHTPEPVPLPLSAVPGPAELAELARSTVVLDMDSGGQIEIRLFPYLAPTNAARFARLTREGYFDGLTFHRVAPNFVIQGGSPGANEYWGDGPYTRDEVGLAGNWRAAVGLSTRGRDTGDAQIYVNLVDNLRLDHQYMVFGEVIRGMDVVDRVLEGEIIVQARVRREGEG
jgi:cyclophilin family peptidyl-prolyl cis-trans isomerase/HEAT repeat protein